ncbi:MAG: glycosyltransferase family 2 protein [Actinobacteria bacterium]|nr:glycosyltransferase family 2 protein [Actinomycetota bacterium]
MDISVIIPTRDRARYLEDCLKTLVGQLPASRMEVIVIDDGSKDDTADVARRCGAKCISQSPAGLNAARNKGAAISDGRIIGYLDDDVLVSPRWAESIVEAFDSPGCQAAGGRISLQFEAPKPRWLNESLFLYLSSWDLGDEFREMAPHEIPLGLNSAVTREAFERLGGFAGGLDREGGSLLSAGDNDFFLRLRRDGGKIWYVPEAAVVHRVPPERMTKSWFRRRAWWQGISDARLGRVVGDDPHRAGATSAMRETLRAFRALPILLANLSKGRGPLTAELWVRHSMGRVAGLRR